MVFRRFSLPVVDMYQPVRNMLLRPLPGTVRCAGDGLLSVVSCVAIPLLLAAMTRLNSFFTLSCMRCSQQVKQV